MSFTRPENNNHILRMSENHHGYDFVIGDLHGNLTPLEEACSYLENANDRLIITGDLLDRGADNPELVEFIINYNYNDDLPGRIYSVCGNHELMNLNTIAASENIIRQNHNALAKIDFTKCDNIRLYQDMCELTASSIQSHSDRDMGSEIDQLCGHCHPANGGAWLVKLFKDELEIGLIGLDDNKHIIYADNSKIKLIRDFISSLPIIIHVDGEHAYHVVHASMPVSDMKLEQLMRDNLGLTDDEVNYAIWARPGSRENPVVDVGRERASIIAFVGHTVIDQHNISECIDGKTNTVYLDCGAYFTNVSIVANPVDNKCMFTKSVEGLISDPEFEYLSSMVEQVEQHLCTQQRLNIMRAQAAKALDQQYKFQSKLQSQHKAA